MRMEHNVIIVIKKEWLGNPLLYVLAFLDLTVHNVQ